MELKEIELEGRKYKAYVSPDEQEGAYVIVGPPEGLVDELGVPPEFATRLHNIFYQRGILSYADAAKKNAIIGALQEALNIDAQLIVEKFHKFETEVVI